VKKFIKKTFDRFFDIMELKSTSSIAMVLVGVLVIMLFSVGSRVKTIKMQNLASDYIHATEQPSEQKAKQKKIYVHVKGEVKSPGLYPLDLESRVCNAIDAAGGFTKNAEADTVNLAKILSDEEEIFIPQKGAIPLSVPLNDAEIKKVNINTATLRELTTLPGIGEVYAGNIISHRNEKGCFTSKEDIMNVKGISKKRFENIKDLISL